MNTYIEMKKRHQEEINAFPIQFAFNQEQLAEGMIKLGLKPSETSKICTVYGGGFILKSDKEKLIDLIKRHKKEQKDAIAADKTGEEFIYEMFDCELGNHEYNYTGDASDALAALGISWEDLKNNSCLRHGFEKACKSQTDQNNNHR